MKQIFKEFFECTKYFYLFGGLSVWFSYYMISHNVWGVCSSCLHVTFVIVLPMYVAMGATLLMGRD